MINSLGVERTRRLSGKYSVFCKRLHTGDENIYKKVLLEENTGCYPNREIPDGRKVPFK